jgi:DNA-binding transcriptional ArsR family regulator
MDLHHSLHNLLYSTERLNEIPLEIRQSDEYRKSLLKGRAANGTIAWNDSLTVHEEFENNLKRAEELDAHKKTIEDMRLYLSVHLKAFEGAGLVYPYEREGKHLKHVVVKLEGDNIKFQ